MGVKIVSTSGGSVEINPPATASNFVATMPARTGTVMMDGPAFSAYQSSAQTVTANIFTKVQFQTEEWDTANCFDNTTNFRFTPNVAGYYQVNFGVAYSTNPSGTILTIYKNGSVYRYVTNSQPSTVSSAYGCCQVYMNGTTDYIEAYVYESATQALGTGIVNTYFQGFLARSAT